MPVIYDIETYPNVFTLASFDVDTGVSVVFELSDRRNDIPALVAWVHSLRTDMVGFNNINFDYPVLHHILSYPTSVTVEDIYTKAMSIIRSNDRFGHIIWPDQCVAPQIDLFKIHHFDNIARSTSLKALQINMRSPSVEDLPFPVGVALTPDQIDTLIAYNWHDVTETYQFYLHTLPQINFRREITERYGHDFMNANDTKIGKDYFIMQLEAVRPGSCYYGKPRQPIQTHRDRIALSDVILPTVQFESDEFNRMLTHLRQTVITETKGALTDLSVEYRGFEFKFGTGGIHGSLLRHHAASDDTHTVIDLDVTSYYPALAIANRFYPAHLGDTFCEIYADMMRQRSQHAKGTPENAMLKLALNGVYGDSNNPYSPFYDPQYTMSITINGQLLLCMLAENLMTLVPDLEMIQINTDGLTVRVPRGDSEAHVADVTSQWERETGLQLEEARYSHMFIRDVNNYIAVGEDGKVKRKGAYEWAPPGERAPTGWHQDCGALIVPMAAEVAMVHGVDVEKFIRTHHDAFDFMCRAKVPRASLLMWGDTQIQNTTRYYVSTDGEALTKVSPPPEGCRVGAYKRASGVKQAEYARYPDDVWNPAVHTKNKSTYAERRMGICAGWTTTVCNRAEDFQWGNINFDWYIEQARKLVI